MDRFIEEYCIYKGWSFDKIIQQYNLNKKTNSHRINCIIDYKIENNKDVIYKEDIPKICLKLYRLDMSQEEFMENVMRDIKYYNLDINNLGMQYYYNDFIFFYYVSTFLEHEPVDIKIALKD
jgi:hypothetical protein